MCALSVGLPGRFMLCTIAHGGQPRAKLESRVLDAAVAVEDQAPRPGWRRSKARLSAHTVSLRIFVRAQAPAEDAPRVAIHDGRQVAPVGWRP